MTKDTLITFAVVNSVGGYWKKGRNYSGRCWTIDINSARFYTRIGDARRVVSNCYKSDPTVPPPIVVKFEAKAIEEIDSHQFVLDKIKADKKKADDREISILKYRAKKAQEDLDRFKKEISNIG